MSNTKHNFSKGAIEDASYIHDSFTSIAHKYELVNTVLSLGMDRWWRWVSTNKMLESKPRNWLDVASGTGDVAAELVSKSPNLEMMASDFCPKMLSYAAKKGLNTQVADAMSLPFESNSFDGVSVSFGLRNMPDYKLALQEMQRVLRPDKCLFILDFSLPRNKCVAALYRLYLHYVLPKIAHLLTGNGGAYKYLAESIESFPCGDTMVDLLKEVGFSSVEVREFSLGTVTLYHAQL